MNYQADNEGAKSAPRREAEGFFTKYIQGKGIDIGHGGTPLTEDCDGWEIDNGDATFIDKPPESYDWVYSSHVLEHLDNPGEAIQNWWKLVKPNGHLIIAVPDEDIYEDGKWPSVGNPDHRNTFTIHKDKSWSPDSINIMDLVAKLDRHKIVYVSICDERYNYQESPHGPTNSRAERQVEIVVRKQHDDDFEPVESQLVTNFKCSCGSINLKVLGIYANGNLLISCMNCGQRSILPMTTIWKQLSVGFRNQ